MLYELSAFESVFGPLRIFKYLTVRCGLAMAFAFILGVMIAPYIITRLKMLKFGQSFRTKEEVGKLAELHEGKKGTPTMGGIIIYLGVVVSVFLFAKPNVLVLASMFVYTLLTLLGFADDYLKVVKKNSKGVSGKTKLFVQTLAVTGVIVILYFSKYSFLLEELYVPFLKNPIFTSIPIFAMFVFVFFVIAGSSNAINLTDGVDGLAIGCTITVAITYAIFSYVAGDAITSQYLFIKQIPECGELTVICFALAGSAMAFLWYNCHPAEVFMGDTGSLALGGLIGTIAFLVQQPITLVIVGGIFVMEAGSVIIQVASFKATGKRVFLCTPIHHHFEYKNWKETKVVIRFWIMSLIFALAGLATLKLR